MADEALKRDIVKIAVALNARLGRAPTEDELYEFIMAPKCVRDMFWETKAKGE